MPPSRTTGGRRGGYTLIELLVVNLLMTLLVVLIAGAWRAFGPLCVEVIGRGRVVNEANIAAAALYQDANSHNLGVLGSVEAAGESSLVFKYGDDASGPSVTYSVQPPPNPPAGSAELLLVRTIGDSSVTIARHLLSATARDLGAVGSTGKSQVEFTLTFACRGSQSTYTFAIHN